MKRIIIFMLVFVYAFTVSIRANALVSPSDFDSLKTMGWASETANVASDGTLLRGGGVAVEAESTALGKISSIVSTPATARIVKGLAGGLGTMVVQAIVFDLVGHAVDYVLDPKNNRITYKDTGNYSCISLIDNKTKYSSDPKSSLQAVCNAQGGGNLTESHKGAFGGEWYGTCENTRSATSTDNLTAGVNCTADTVDKNIDLATIANILKQKANQGDKDAQGVLEDLVKQMLADKDPEIMDPLVANAKDKDPATDPAKDPSTDPTKDPSKDKDKDKDPDPTTCGTGTHLDGTTKKCVPDDKKGDDTNFVCDAFPLFTKVCDAIDWGYSKDDIPKDGDGNVDIPDDKSQTIDTDISFGGSCPANVVVPFGLPGYETDITVMDFSNFCQILSTYLRPLVIALASYQAVRILAGQKE